MRMALSRTENRDLMTQARESLSGQWGLAIGGTVVFTFLLGLMGVVPIIGPLAGLFINGPLMLGGAIFYLAFVRGKPKISQLFDGFQNFATSMCVYLLSMLYIVLWSLLLIVPGIIAAFSYSMAYYIINDDDSISASEALAKSKKMMDGNKWKYFCLQWRFFGWYLLALLTCGLGVFAVIPYLYVSNVQFYEDIKGESDEQ